MKTENVRLRMRHSILKQLHTISLKLDCGHRYLYTSTTLSLKNYGSSYKKRYADRCKFLLNQIFRAYNKPLLTQTLLRPADSSAQKSSQLSSQNLALQSLF